MQSKNFQTLEIVLCFEKWQIQYRKHLPQTTCQYRICCPRDYVGLSSLVSSTIEKVHRKASKKITRDYITSHSPCTWNSMICFLFDIKEVPSTRPWHQKLKFSDVGYKNGRKLLASHDTTNQYCTDGDWWTSEQTWAKSFRHRCTRTCFLEAAMKYTATAGDYCATVGTVTPWKSRSRRHIKGQRQWPVSPEVFSTTTTTTTTTSSLMHRKNFDLFFHTPKRTILPDFLREIFVDFGTCFGWTSKIWTLPNYTSWALYRSFNSSVSVLYSLNDA